MTLWFAGSCLYRVLIAARRSPHLVSQSKNRWNTAGPVWLMSGSIILISGSILVGGRMFFRGQLLTALSVMGWVLLSVAVVDGVLAIWRPASHNPKTSKFIMPLLSLCLGIVFLSYVLYLRSVPKPNENTVYLSYPVKGTWEIIAGGRSHRTNYHHNNPAAQNYAVDIIRIDGPSEGAPVFAPVAGDVILAVNDQMQGSDKAEGNIVIIQTPGGSEVWLAHLQRGSVLVKQGDPVSVGQEIAKCGSTGSADQAHLHIHAQQEGLPQVMLFGKEHKFLIKGNYIKN